MKMLKEFKAIVGSAVLALLVFPLLPTGCSGGKEEARHSSAPEEPPPKPLLNLVGRFSPAIFSSHDLYLTNTTGTDLSEVRLRIKFVGENASPEVTRYWASWPLGMSQQITILESEVKNVQRVEVSGEADNGRFNGSIATK